jgi:hypothetical protein
VTVVSMGGKWPLPMGQEACWVGGTCDSGVYGRQVAAAYWDRLVGGHPLCLWEAPLSVVSIGGTTFSGVYWD